MGVYLSTPCTDMEIETGSEAGISYAVGEMQGWRKNMEDAHITNPNVNNSQDANNDDKIAVFGVFDGHGGKEVAKFCQLYFLNELTSTPEYKEKNFKEALRKNFHRMDELLEDEKYDYQLQQFRRIPNPSDKKNPAIHQVSSSDDEHEEEDGVKKPNNKIPISEALSFFQKLLEKEKELALKPEQKNDDDSNNEMSDGNSNEVESTTEVVSMEVEESSTIVISETSSSKVGQASDDNFVVERSIRIHETCTLSEHRIGAGCTAVVALKNGNTLYVANAGDSRAVLCRGDGTAYPLSFDHKPQDKVENDRIVNAGGFVNGVGRINGNLNLSRAIGDLKYKQHKGLSRAQQIITAEPDITETQLTQDDRFVVLACDGVWDCFTNQEICDFINQRREKNMSIEDIVKDVFNFCVSRDPRETAGIGGDNMTCIIVDLTK